MMEENPMKLDRVQVIDEAGVLVALIECGESLGWARMCFVDECGSSAGVFDSASEALADFELHVEARHSD